MADIRVTGIGPEKILTLSRIVKGVTLYQFSKDDDSFIRIVPAEISLESDKYVNSKGRSRMNWVRKFTYNVNFFDFEEFDFFKYFEEKRSEFHQAVIFTQMTETDANEKRFDWIKVETVNAYLMPGEDVVYNRVRDLPDDLKRKIFDQASLEVANFLLDHVKPEMANILKTVEEAIRMELEVI